MSTASVNSHNGSSPDDPLDRGGGRASGRRRSALGTAPAAVERITAEDLRLLRDVAAVLEAGLPLVALLQLVRVDGQAMARVADAELEAVDAVEQFVDSVHGTLPDDAPVNYWRDVNIASRVAARAAGAEVLVTRPVVEHARGGLEFDRIADVRLKGFNESTEIFIARERDAA